MPESYGRKSPPIDVKTYSLESRRRSDTTKWFHKDMQELHSCILFETLPTLLNHIQQQPNYIPVFLRHLNS